MDKYQRDLKGLNEQQRQAVEQVYGPVLVIAGPGTGKTQLLSVRIAYILDKTDALPQNILCLTFTESAANNMRKRLVGLIGQAAYSVTISTYHAFGSELIRRYPDYFSATMPNARPIDALGIDQLLRQIMKGLPYSNPLKNADTYIADIKSVIGDFKKALLTPDDVEAIADHNTAFIESASKIIQKSLSNFTRIDKKSLALFEDLAKKTLELATKPGIKGSSVLPLGQMWQEQLQAATEEANLSQSTKPLTAWKKDWLAKDSQNRFIIAGKQQIDKLRAAATIYRQYLALLEQKQLYDYDDMILRAIKGLEQHNDLKYTLQEQYQFMLLDEFQDTNGAQLRLVELLADNPTNEGKPNVLAVGDDDQAIFAFQGADYSHMLAFARNYRDVLVVPLTQNYRSHADILKLADGIAEQIDERLHHNFEGISKKLTAIGSKLPQKAVLSRLEFKSDVAQFAWVAQQIKELIDKGLAPNQIAVLVPQHRYLEPLLPYLQQQNVAVRYEKRENILDYPLINELLQMTRLVLALGRQSPEANTLWPEILSYAFWGLKTTDIWQLAWAANDQKTDITKLMLDNPTFQPIADFFIGLSFGQGSMTLELMLDYLIGSQAFNNFTSPFFGHYFAADKQTGNKFWALLSDLTVLRQTLRDYRIEDDSPLTTQDFVDFVEVHRAANIKILNSSPYSQAVEAVELMTAYKAKGREFGAVFVLACSNEVWSTQARTNNSKISLPMNLQFIRYGGASEDERLRLFYVALTRAKSKLFLTNYSSNFANKSFSRLKYLNEVEEDDGTIISPMLPAGQQLVAQPDIKAPAANQLAAYWQQRHSDLNAQVSMRAMLKERLERFRLAPTHVNDFTDAVYGGPQHFFMNSLLRFPSSISPEGHFGIAVHKTLEQVSYYQRQHHSLPNQKELMALLDRQIRKQRLDAASTKQLLERGHSSLWSYLQQKQASFVDSDLPEYSFRNEGVQIGKALLTGTIDKLVIDRTSKTIQIIDYKTGKSHNRWMASDAKLYKYAQQLYIYKLLVENSHTFKGYHVDGAALEFVEPNNEGKVVDLPLHYDDKELERSRRLIEVVWQHIMDLNFPDISGYRQDLKGIQQFQQDLLDGKI